MTAAWKSVVGFEGFYEVSSDGRVRSVPRLDSRKIPRGGHLMKLQVSKQGYLVVYLRRDGKSRLRKVHQLVLEAFVGLRPTDAHHGCHNDGNKVNNTSSNLRWGTPSENNMDKALHGTLARGEKNGGGGKLTEEQVKEIKVRVLAETQVDLAREFGVSQGLIGHIKNGRAWRHV